MQHGIDTGELLINGLKTHYQKFHGGLDNRNVASRQLTLADDSLSQHGCTFEALDKHITEYIEPFLSASNGGRYLGFVTGGANPVATYADWLVSTFDQNVSKGGDSIATSVEYQALKWVKQLFTLPGEFDGVFTTGATAANFLGAITSRQFLGNKQGINVALQGMQHLELYTLSATPHASMVKSLGMAGFGQNKWIQIDCLEDSEAMDVNALEAALKTLGGKSAWVIASAGTVTGTDFDDLLTISELCRQYGAWLHVDAAFGMFERLVTGIKGRTQGIEFADSITLDCHKWLNVPYDCGVFFTRHKQLLQDSCEVFAPYLVNNLETTDFMSLGIENSRRFRGFPVWATLKAYGVQGVAEAVKNNIQQAKKLADWLDRSQFFTLVKECHLNIVLFKPDPLQYPFNSAETMASLNQQGDVFFSPGVWKGQPIIRAAFSNWGTQQQDLDKIIYALDKLTDDLKMSWSKVL